MNIFKWATNKKYRIFTRKIADVDVSIWEYEFKVAKSRQVREGIRQDRDRAIENIQRLDTLLKDEKDPQKVAMFTEDIKKHADNKGRYEGQMKMIDDQINGVPTIAPTAQNPEGQPGQQGIVDTIASLTELKSMYKDYRKSI